MCSGSKIIKGMEEMTVVLEKGMSNGQEIVIMMNKVLEI